MKELYQSSQAVQFAHVELATCMHVVLYIDL